MFYILGKLWKAFLNIFTMIVFGMLEGLWMLFVPFLVIGLLFNLMTIFWIVFIGFWIFMILFNAIGNKNFWE